MAEAKRSKAAGSSATVASLNGQLPSLMSVPVSDPRERPRVVGVASGRGCNTQQPLDGVEGSLVSTPKAPPPLMSVSFSMASPTQRNDAAVSATHPFPVAPVAPPFPVSPSTHDEQRSEAAGTASHPSQSMSVLPPISHLRT